MSYDEQLAARVRDLVAGHPGVTEKRMFGGLAFLVDGLLALSACSGGGILVRVEASLQESLLREEGVKPFEMRGRAMTGWLHVDAAAVADDDALLRWTTRGITCAETL